MSEISMKKDLQEALSHGVMKYAANYNSLIFNKANAYMIQSFFFMKNIKINIVDNNFRFNIELDELVTKIIDSKTMEKIQQRNIENKIVEGIANTLENMTLKFKNEIIENVINMKNEDMIDVKIDSEDKEIMQMTKQIFEMNSDIKLKQINNGRYFGLLAKKEEIVLNKTLLMYLMKIVMNNIVDVLIISPHFDENNDVEEEKMKGISICIAIDKKRYEEE